VVSFTGFSSYPNYDGTNDTIGWEFTVAPGAGITVDSLGWLDTTPGTPLGQSHEVGIWNLSGQLLGSTTVQTTDPLTGSFRYDAVTPFVLAAGTTYVIGGEDSSPFSDYYESGASSITVDPAIVFDGAAVTAARAGFAAPLIVTAGDNGRFGPNFDFTSNVVVTSSVPEPSPLWLCMAGLGMLALVRMRRSGGPARFARGTRLA